MSRKRLTQVFPFLLPLRLWQRKKFYYLKMRLDKNRYAAARARPFPCELAADARCSSTSAPARIFAINTTRRTTCAASAAVNHVVIRPGETFSLWWLVRPCRPLREVPGRPCACATGG